MGIDVPFAGSIGYWVLLGVGFVEYAGLPIASMPILITAGAFTATGVLHPVPVVLAAALGGWIADTLWFLLARWRGPALVHWACGLSSNPGACSLKVMEQVRRLRPGFVLTAKFLPGVGNLIAPAAGFAGRPARVFLAFDAAALVLWAGAWTTVGWLAQHQVLAAVRIAVRFVAPVSLGAVALIVGASIFRLVKVSHHSQAHARAAAAAQNAPAPPEPGGLVFVYNADGGLVNGLLDLAHKVFAPATYSCSLCAVTHSPLGMRRRWKEFLADLGRPTEFLHRDELPTRYGLTGVALPAVFRKTEAGIEPWIAASDLNHCRTLGQLEDLLRARLSQDPV